VVDDGKCKQIFTHYMVSMSQVWVSAGWSNGKLEGVVEKGLCLWSHKLSVRVWAPASVKYRLW